MASTFNPMMNSSDPPETSTTTTESSTEFDLPGYIEENYIIIVIPSVFACVFLIIIFLLLIRKILKNRHSFDPKQLETYASVNYDDESIDDELDGTDDLVYTSCKLLVGDGYEDNVEASNSEPEYDCMSVDVSVGARESSIIDLSNRKTSSSLESSQEVSRSLKSLPQNFWKR